MAINNIKIKSHDIYLEKDNNKGGNLQIGTLTTNPNKLGSLTVYGNVNMTSPAISMSGAKSVNINTPTLNVTGNVAMRDGKLSMWPTSIDIIESSNGSFNIDTPTLSYNSSEERLVVTNLNIQGANIGVIPSESLCVTAIASINDGGITTKITDELNIGANINNAGIKLNGNLIQTNSSGEIIENMYSQMSITSSISLKANNIIANTNSMVTVENNSIVLKTENEKTNKYAILSIRNNSIGITARDASFNGTTSNFTINPESLNIKAPDIVVNTNKIDLIQNNSSTPINIDDLIKYTPSTIPTGEVKSWVCDIKCDLSRVYSTTNKTFAKESSGSETYYYLTISQSLSDTQLKYINTYKAKLNSITLTIKITNISTPEVISLKSNNLIIYLSTSSKPLRVKITKSDSTAYNKLADIESKLKSGVYNNIEYVSFRSITLMGNDANIEVDQCSKLQINDNKHLLLTTISTGTTNISYFPNAVYNPDKNRLMVTAVDQVILYPGDFIEYYPIGDENSYKWCFIHSNGEYGINIDETNGLPTNGLPGYIFYSATGITAGKVYVFHNNTITRNSATDSKGNLLDHVSIDFREDRNIAGEDVGSAYVIIKR